MLDDNLYKVWPLPWALTVFVDCSFLVSNTNKLQFFFFFLHVSKKKKKKKKKRKFLDFEDSGGMFKFHWILNPLLLVAFSS